MSDVDALVSMTLTVVAAVFWAISLSYWGKKLVGYRQIEHTISELAASGNATEQRVSYGFFMPLGMAMAIVAYLTMGNEATLLLSLSLAVGYIGAALFPIDQGAPMMGSWKNAVHTLCGSASYLLALAGFEGAGREMGMPYTMGKFLVLAFVGIVYFPRLRDFRGLAQKVLEVAIFAGVFFSVKG